MKRALFGGIAVGILIGFLVNATALLAIARSRDDDGQLPVYKRLADIEQGILDLQAANRIQDAHIVNTYLARMRAARTELAAGRTEHARILATSALTGMIGLYHERCGGTQDIEVPAVNIPQELRSFFGEKDPYTITGVVTGSDPEKLAIRINQDRMC